jgi:hypothetical protein
MGYLGFFYWALTAGVVGFGAYLVSPKQVKQQVKNFFHIEV